MNRESWFVREYNTSPSTSVIPKPKEEAECMDRAQTGRGLISPDLWISVSLELRLVADLRNTPPKSHQ